MVEVYVDYSEPPLDFADQNRRLLAKKFYVPEVEVLPFLKLCT